MQSIVCVNFEIPTIEDGLDYNDDGSLRDYDIAVFSPELPYYERVEFTGGGSCLSIDATNNFQRAGSHWSRELRDALAAGKTVFVVLSPYETKSAATGYTTGARGARTYHTVAVNNYGVIPGQLPVRNARGSSIVVKDAAFKGLYAIIKDMAEYRVVFDGAPTIRTTFAAKDGTCVGGVAKFTDWPGHLVLIPYFDFSASEFLAADDKGEVIWSEKALKTSHALVGQLLAIDRTLKGSTGLTPPPDWLGGCAMPKAVTAINGVIAEIEAQIGELHRQREAEAARKAEILEYSYLLYENGKALELAIEKALRLLGFTVETLRIGDLEIDHVIVGPNGVRMIGESEGKDTSAIDIGKFRQLESNIGEDFEREEVAEPAKGVLFGNGYRLTAPASRAEQFTLKSLTNARRLGSALIRTADLYAVALHLLDNPQDEDFRSACREKIEQTSGGIVEFPLGKTKKAPDAEAPGAT